VNNQPAFPLHNHGAQTLGLHVTGMTLRDYFAAKAMQGLLASEVNAPMKTFANMAYNMADLMMEARNGSQ
jgi:hypothetical protein